MRFTPLARQKKLEFVIECSESIYASIDREALTKIISNLFTNAIKYSETYIHVRLWMEDTCWFLSVCNDGNVIPMEMREEILSLSYSIRTDFPVRFRVRELVWHWQDL